MKYLITLFAALFIGLCSQLPVLATWGHVQGTTQGETAGTPNVIPYGSNVTMGNMALVCVATGVGATITVSDTQTNTWILAGSLSASPRTEAIYYAIINASGADTVTVNVGGNNQTTTIDEYSFTPGTLSLTTANNSNSSTSASVTTGNVTFTANKALGVMAFCLDLSTATPTAGTGFFLRENGPYLGGSYVGNAMEDWLNATSSPISPTATIGGGGAPWTAVSVAFQSSGDAVASAPARLTGSALLMQ